MTIPSFDVAIVGGGLVGASLALALANSGLAVAVLEHSKFRASGPPGFDDRTLALSLASQNIFTAIGLWQKLDQGLTPIREVLVSQRGLPGRVRLRADDYDLAALGHVVEARAIGQVVAAALPTAQGVSLLMPATVTAVAAGSDNVTVDYEQDGQTSRLTTRLLVGADGTHSAVRKMLGMPVQSLDYQQAAIIANVSPQYDHKGRAFEHLTDTGPLAILPHVNRRCGSVWVTTQDQVKGLLELSDEDYLQRLQQRFGYRLGRLHRVGARASYPLSRVYAPEPVAQRCVLIGNAAHTIHPIAAQGFNLGLRDVAALTELLLGAHAAGGDPGSADLLNRYQEWRRPDVERTMNFTDALMRLFAQPLPLVRVLRSVSLIGMQLLPQARAALAQRTMGFSGRVPLLARGGFDE